MKIQMFVAGMLCAATLVGCSNSPRNQIADTIKVNQEAQSLVEWESSESNPEALFEKWREEAKSSPELKGDICAELSRIDDQSLTLFEEELKKPENQNLINDCKAQLDGQIESYYAAQRTTEEAAPLKIAVKEELRDYSNGYYVVAGDVGPKELVLTFDDGPNATYTPMILKALRDVGAKVMFFNTAKSVRATPETVKKVAADGHMIGSHSITHRCLGTRVNCARANGRLLTFDEAVAEIKGGHQAVYDVLGWVDPIFRFPFGESSPELKNYLKTHATGEFFWSIDSNDWRAQTNENLLRTTLAQIDQRGRGVVLFHDIQRKTAEILPTFLREIAKRGFTLVVLKPTDSNARYNSKIVTKRLP